MKKILYTLIALLIAIPAYAQQSNVNLLYIAKSDPADGTDAILIDSLEAMGYVVTPLVGDAYNEFSHTDYGADVIVFGEPLSSSKVTPFATAMFPVPCVSMEGFCVRENRWALTTNDKFFQIGTETPPTVYDPAKHYGIKVKVDHPITNYAGLSMGDEVLWSSETDTMNLPPQNTYFDLPMTDAVAVGDIKGETDWHTLWAIEPNAADTTNPLNHRMVIWGIHENGLTQATPVFYQILDGAILWTLGLNNTANDNLFEEDARLSAIPNPFTDFTKVEFHLTQPGQVSMEVYDMTGRMVFEQASQFAAGKQRMSFTRPATMAPGMYQFIVRQEGKALGTGKMIMN